MWVVKEHGPVTLPFIENEDGSFGLRKNPGDKITKSEMEQAKQTDEDIARLIADDAIEEA